MACNGKPGTALQGFVLFSGLLGATVPCLQVDTASCQVCCPRGVHILHENIQASIAPLWASLPPRAADGGAPNSFCNQALSKTAQGPFCKETWRHLPCSKLHPHMAQIYLASNRPHAQRNPGSC